jgi:hypothetical protein
VTLKPLPPLTAMIFIRAKIGTWPAGFYRAMRKKNKPKVGDRLVLRSDMDWEDFNVVVNEIRQVDDKPLYIVERI